MTPEVRDRILSQLAEHRIMTLATNRKDGWPQATTVSYVNESLILYCFIARAGQKFANILRDPRVSIAIAGDFSKPENIKGLSLAGKGRLVESKSEYERVCALLAKRFPEYADWPTPNSAFAPLLRIEPEVISVLDYSKGFGHSDLVVVARRDLEEMDGPRRQNWLGHGASTPAP
jgi:nitroimidazol reductase NimA-like FMN-containing flavoprotein (pyridoxamine 5'-phosphate oxidase superfamily)